MRAFFISCFIFLLAACASQSSFQQSVASWQGVNTQELLNQWGKPYFTDLTDSHRKLYVYNTPSYATYPSEYHDVPAVNTSGNKPVIVNVPKPTGVDRKRQCYISFIADQRNIIVSTTVHGNNCEPVQTPK